MSSPNDMMMDDLPPLIAVEDELQPFNLTRDELQPITLSAGDPPRASSCFGSFITASPGMGLPSPPPHAPVKAA